MSQPLDLKYRPRKFSQVLGQKVHLQILGQRLREESLARVLLIDGPHSTGKTTIARIIARRVNCLSPDEENPCGNCASCKVEPHPDIHEMNAASDRGIDTIREIAEMARLTTTYASRVFILDEAHAVTPQAWQASLKLFEEPPAESYFILLTTEAQKIPETIRSRCTKIVLTTIPIKTLADRLLKIAAREGSELDENTARRIADVSKGHPREALHLLEQVLKGGADSIPEKDLEAILEDSPTRFLPEFLGAFLSLDLVKAVALADTVDNPIRLLEQAVEAFRGLLRLSVDQRLGSGYHVAVLQPVLAKHRKITTEQLTAIFKIFAKYCQLAKTFDLPDTVCRDLAVFEAATVLSP